MTRYTDSSRERVRDAVDMVDLVGARVELRRAGASRYTGLCPFHDERSPSFGIDPAQKVFYCFGCGEGGDVFRYVELTEGADFKGALELLADRYGVELEREEEDAESAERRRRRERLLELLERTAAYYVRVLWESDEARPAREYLLGRGLEEAVLREFRVGYAPSAWDRVLAASRRAGFSNRELHEAGLAQRGRDGGRIFDRFRRRITFPLCDPRGRVLGFGARAIGADQQPKYLNSPEGAVFHKGRHLFAADVARAAATKAGEVLLAEGYTDVIALHQAGLRNTVGLMGTALTEEQVGELSRLAPVVLLALDADSAGQEAMLRAARVAAGRRLELRVVPLPEGLDPADLVAQEGAAAIRERAARSVPFVRFRVERELDRADLSSAEGKDRAIDALRPVFAALPPSALREELLGLVAERVDIAPSLVSSWLEQPGGGAGAGGHGRRAPGGGDGPAPAGGGAAVGGRPAAGDRAAAGGTSPPQSAAALDAVGRAERAFLAQCLAQPGDGAALLAELDLEEDFDSDLTRRAAAHLREHLDAPGDGLPPDDEDLRALVAELTIRAGELQPSRAALEADALNLDVLRVERRIAAARATGAATTDLVTRREELRHRRDLAIERVMEETEPAGR
jgi:DNA primase